MLLSSSLLALSLLAQQPDYSMRTGYVSLAALTAADNVQTGAALERGFSERNPILKPFATSPTSLGLVNGAMSGAIGLAAYKLHRAGKRKEARIFLWTMTGLKALVVIHNARQLSQDGR